MNDYWRPPVLGEFMEDYVPDDCRKCPKRHCCNELSYCVMEDES